MSARRAPGIVHTNDKMKCEPCQRSPQRLEIQRTPFDRDPQRDPGGRSRPRLLTRHQDSVGCDHAHPIRTGTPEAHTRQRRLENAGPGNERSPGFLFVHYPAGRRDLGNHQEVERALNSTLALGGSPM